MKKNIELREIKVKKNRIYYTIVDNSGMNLLKKSIVNAWIQFDHTEEFDFTPERLPFSVLAIPISLYLLPVTYYYPVELRLPVMDKMLYEDLDNIYKAYGKIYGTLPENELDKRGNIFIQKIEENKLPSDNRFEKIVFFSGGVDACSAGINNADAKSVLVSIPSIEGGAKNRGGLRKEKYALIKNFSKIINSPWVLISNNFNEELFNDNLIQLHLKEFLTSEAFNFDGWFGIKYLANISCVAPFAYAYGISELIMGSSYEQLENDKIINQDGANPILSDSLAFAGIHFSEQDGQYTRRQKKTQNIIDWCNNHHTKIKIQTCFSNSSKQCCICPKCVRTQLNILTCCENPKAWGFTRFSEKKFTNFMKTYSYWERNPCWLWDNIDSIEEGKTYLYCNELLHWLKKVGYKEYLAKSKEIVLKRNIIKTLLRINRYPHYIFKIFMKLFRKEA